MNKTTGWIIGIIVVAILGYIIYVQMSPSAPSATTQNASGATGTVAVSFTDATAAITNVSDISMGVNKVELYSAAQGWVTVPGNSMSYDLLTLHAKGQAKIYATAQVAADTYTQTRVTLGSVVVKTTSGAQKTAALPGQTITINGTVNVAASTTASVKFDVLADKSLHAAANGAYVFAPVVNEESRSNAAVSTAADGTVTESGGSLDAQTSVGMDVDGSVKQDFVLSQSAKLNVSASGVVNLLNGGTGSGTGANGSTGVQGSVNGPAVQGTMRVNTGVNAGGATPSSNSSTNGAVNGTVNGVINY